MKILAIDWGTKRVGLAVAAADLKLVQPLSSLDNSPQLVDNLRGLSKAYAIEKLVIGLPRDLNGEETAMARRVRQFGDGLSARLDLPVVYQDETLTSVEAGSAASKPKIDIDSDAAAIILRDYLGVSNETLADL